jgi:hypothetical protein
MGIYSFGNCSEFEVEVGSPNIISATVWASMTNWANITSSFDSFSRSVSVPLIWDQENDTYYEPSDTNYYQYVGSSSQITSSKGYVTSPDLTPHSYIKVANVLNDRSVKYYISLKASSYLYKPGYLSDNATVNPTEGKIAGRWEKFSFLVHGGYFHCMDSSYAISSTFNGDQSVNYNFYSNPPLTTSDSASNWASTTNGTTPTTFTSAGYQGGVLGPNGKIYCVPHNQTNILVLNPANNTASTSEINITLGPDTSKWIGGVLGPNGKIYCVPYNATNILVINPANNSASTTEITTITPTNALTGSGKWSRGVLGPNGKIYCVPYNATNILVINPANNSASTSEINITLASTTAKWQGGVLAPNGKIYCVPYEAANILVIDPVNNSASTTEITTITPTNALTGSAKWVGGVLAPNGKIYCGVHNATNILVIDPANNSASTSAINITLASTTAKWGGGGVLAPNGRIYCGPQSAGNILVIDPVANTASIWSPAGVSYTNSGWIGEVLAPNGKIYCVPYNATNILTITPGQERGHDLLTGSPVRAISGGGIEKDRIYYAIKESERVIRLADSYIDAIALRGITRGDLIGITAGHVFERQAGWIRVEEGDKAYGNGGDPALSSIGEGNEWIRKPYNIGTGKREELPEYNRLNMYFEGDRVIYNGSVWECIANQDINTYILPEEGLVQADFSGKDGKAMIEMPEVYIRKDHYDGYKWWNIKGADVSRDYAVASPYNGSSAAELNGFSKNKEKDFHFLWLLHKKQYQILPDSEKEKYVMHPAFMETTDSEKDRTIRLTADESGAYMPSGYVGTGSGSSITLTSNLTVGKAFVYLNSSTLDYIQGLTSGTTYYITSVSGSTVGLSGTKGGSAISVVSSTVLYGGYHGVFRAVVTKGDVVVTVSTTTGAPATFTSTIDHQLMIGQRVQLFFSGSLANFVSGATYYVLNPNYTTNTFTLATSLANAIGNTAINYSSQTQLSNLFVRPIEYIESVNPEVPVSSISGSNTLNLDWLPGYTDHLFKTGDTVIYKGSIAGLTSGNYYFVIRVSSTQIRLASSYLNANNSIAISISGSTNLSTVNLAPFSEITFPGRETSVAVVNQEAPPILVNDDAAINWSPAGVTYTTFGWYGGVLAPNGKIYCVPHVATNILVIDSVANTASNWSPAGVTYTTYGWSGGVLAPNGKIYCVPHAAANILVIDPVANTASNWASTTNGTTPTTFNTNGGWTGGVLAPNGKIYCVPYAATNILVIDPVANTASNWSPAGVTIGGWHGGVLVPNGKIYCVPYNATNILVIDPVANTASNWSPAGVTYTSAGWVRGVLAPNGKIYCVPFYATNILVIDPVANTASNWSPAGVTYTSAGWVEGVLAPNGKIYCAPAQATNILVIDPVANTASNWSPGVTYTSAGWYGVLLAQNGKIYSVPLNANNILTITPSTPYSRANKAVYKSLFLADVEAKRISVSSITTTVGSAITFTANGHGLKTGQRVFVYFRGSLANVVNGGIYYIVSAATNTFSISSTLGGTAISFTSQTSVSAIQIGYHEATSRKIGGSNVCKRAITRIDSNKIYTELLDPPGAILTENNGVNPGDLYRTGQQVYFDNLYDRVYNTFTNRDIIITSVNTTTGTLGCSSGNISSIINTQVIRFTNVGGLTNVNTSTDYFIINVNSVNNTFQLSLTQNGTAVAIGGSISSNPAITCKIFSELQKGTYFIRVAADKGISLYNSYLNAVNNTGALALTNQPVTTVQGFYGALSGLTTFTTTGPAGYSYPGTDHNFEIGNAGSLFRNGGVLLSSLIPYFVFTEVRRFNVVNTEGEEFKKSNRIALCNLGRWTESGVLADNIPMLKLSSFNGFKKDFLPEVELPYYYKLYYVQQRGIMVLVGAAKHNFYQTGYQNEIEAIRNSTSNQSGFMFLSSNKNITTLVIKKNDYSEDHRGLTVWGKELLSEEVIDGPTQLDAITGSVYYYLTC